MPQPPTQQFQTKVIYDFVTDQQLVAKMIGYRQQQGFTVIVVNGQPDVEANFVTDLPQGGFPVKTSLGIVPGTQTWTIISHG